MQGKLARARGSTTSFLTATTLKYAFGAGITAAAGHFGINYLLQIPDLTSTDISFCNIVSKLLYETALHNLAPLQGD
jgi:hypothetical protein